MRARAEAVDDADDLMARDHRHPVRREVALDDVEVRPADGARADPDAELARPGFGVGPFDALERPGVDRRLAAQHHGLHDALPKAAVSG